MHLLASLERRHCIIMEEPYVAHPPRRKGARFDF